MKRLMAGGVIPPIENPLRQAPRLTLDRVGGPVDSFIYALPTRGYGIVTWVRIVALKSGIKLSGCQVTPRRWDDADIDVLDAPEALRYYKAIGGAEYPKENVLNNWISSNRCLNFGKVLEGGRWSSGSCEMRSVALSAQGARDCSGQRSTQAGMALIVRNLNPVMRVSRR